MSLFEELESRGFIKQMTHEYEIKKNINEDKVVFYIGYDPTADSLTVGHFVTLMFMAHMQKYGHKPIVLVGGGTVMVGDPTGKTDMRKMLSRDVIEENIRKIKGQISKFIDFSDKALEKKGLQFKCEGNRIYFAIINSNTFEAPKIRRVMQFDELYKYYNMIDYPIQIASEFVKRMNELNIN